MDLPQYVTVFAKWPNTLIGDGAPIVIPPSRTASTTRRSSRS